MVLGSLYIRGHTVSILLEKKTDNELIFFLNVSFHVKFVYMGCCDFSINNPQNTCLVT